MRINDANLLRQVVNYLHNHREAVRIKKMLYCLCTNRWEKDIEYLNSINSEYLIEQIIREYNTLEQLKFLLQRLVKTVNKPKQYIEIAKIIYLAIGQLYPEFQREHGGNPLPSHQTQTTSDSSSTVSPVPSALQRAYTPEPTQATEAQPIPSALQRAYTPEPTQATEAQPIPSALQRAYAPEPTQADDGKTLASALYRAYAPEPTYPELPPEPAPGDLSSEYSYETYYDPEGAVDPNDGHVVPEYDLFTLRQNVMCYSNPLRAKILMLLMLRPYFDFSGQVATAMRDYHLDDLLFETLKTFPTIQSLEESMTSAVEQLIEVEEYGKAATGLLQSLVPLYASKYPN
jgi:hypothetical protein